jgi:hypothetical protein
MADFASLYTIEPMYIAEYMADTKCYRARKLNASVIPEDYFLSSIGGTHSTNTDQGTPQVYHVYKPETVVLACVAIHNASNSAKQRVGYILGEITLPITARENTTKEKIEAQIKDSTTAVNADSIFRTINNTNQTTCGSTFYAIDHFNYRGDRTTEDIPGDYSIEGKHTDITVDDYAIHIGTDCAHTVYSAVAGERIDFSFSLSETTAISERTTYIVDNSPLFVSKYSYDIGQSFFDCYDITDNVLTRNGTHPTYAYVETISPKLGGRIETLYNKPKDTATDETTPLYQEQLDNNGSLNIKTVSGIRLSHDVSDYFKIACNGDLIQGTENVAVSLTKTPVEETQYDKETSSTFRPALKRKKITNALGEDLEVFMGQSCIELAPDGSIKIQDAWGSYILLSKGNIQIHAYNDCFITAGRALTGISADKLLMTSAVATEISSDKLTRVIGSDCLDIAGRYTTYKADTLKANLSNSLQISSPITTVKATHMDLGDTMADVVIRGQNILACTEGTFTATAGLNCFVVGADATYNIAELRVGSNIHIENFNYSVTVDNKKLDYQGINNASLFIYDGQLQSRGDIITTGALIGENVCAQSVSAVDSSDGLMFSLKRLDLTTLKNKKPTKIDRTTYHWSSTAITDILDNTYNTFTVSERAVSMYLAQTPDETAGSSHILGTLYSGKTNEASKKYKLLTQEFWDTSGLFHSVGKTLGGFSGFRGTDKTSQVIKTVEDTKQLK